MRMTPTSQISTSAQKISLRGINYKEWSIFQSAQVSLLNDCRADIYISFSGHPSGDIEIIVINDFSKYAEDLCQQLYEADFEFSKKVVKYTRPLGSIMDKFNVFGSTGKE